jgi:HNH endonuclease
MTYIHEQDIELLRSKEHLLWRNITLISDFPEDCWLWHGSTNQWGYGSITLKATILDGRIRIGAHRLSYLLFMGSISENLLVLHKCDEPRCCNPSHLWLGTQKDNIEDMFKKGRENNPKGYTHSEEIRKKMSKAQRKSWGIQ